jgi:hypothetical protein
MPNVVTAPIPTAAAAAMKALLEMGLPLLRSLPDESPLLSLFMLHLPFADRGLVESRTGSKFSMGRVGIHCALAREGLLEEILTPTEYAVAFL